MAAVTHGTQLSRFYLRNEHRLGGTRRHVTAGRLPAQRARLSRERRVCVRRRRRAGVGCPPRLVFADGSQQLFLLHPPHHEPVAELQRKQGLLRQK